LLYSKEIFFQEILIQNRIECANSDAGKERIKEYVSAFDVRIITSVLAVVGKTHFQLIFYGSFGI